MLFSSSSISLSQKLSVVLKWTQQDELIDARRYLASFLLPLTPDKILPSFVTSCKQRDIADLESQIANYKSRVATTEPLPNSNGASSNHLTCPIKCGDFFAPALLP